MRAPQLLLVLPTLWLAACNKTSDPKLAACEAIVACACSEPQYATVEACMADVDAARSEMKQAAASNGLAFDEECFDELLGRVEVLECGAPSTIDQLADFLCPYCNPVHGERAAGAACTVAANRSECARDLVCIGVDGEGNGVCAPLCDQPAPGEKCRFKDPGGGSGSYASDCQDGYYCGASDTCEASLSDGATCMSDNSCASGNCNATNVCSVPPGKGQSCDDLRCADPLVCDIDSSTCVDRPAVGQPCVFGACVDGARCDETDVCVAEEALVCEISFTNDDAMMPGM
jgi:hypothetical protein